MRLAVSALRDQTTREGGDQMDVRIKEFNVEMDVKTSGIEFQVRPAGGGNQIGDCYVTKTGLTWCIGKTTKPNGVAISWNDLATVLASRRRRALL